MLRKLLAVPLLGGIVACAGLLGIQGAQLQPDASTPPGTCAGEVCDASLDPGPCDAATLASDPLHCGACNHSCLGGKCRGGTCQPVKVRDAPNAKPTGVVTDGQYLVWTAADGAGGQTVQSCALPRCDAVRSGVASADYRISKGQVYFAQDASIFVRDLAPDGGSDLIARGGIPDDGLLSIDDEDGLILSSSPNEDADAGLLIEACDLHGDPPCFAYYQTDYPNTYFDFAFVSGDTALVGDLTSLRSCPAVSHAIDSGTGTIAARYIDRPQSFRKGLLVGTFGGSTIASCKAPSCDPQPVYKVTGRVYATATDGTRAYWLDSNGSISRCAVASCAKPEVLFTDGNLASVAAASLAIDDVSIFWSNNDAIYRLAF